MKDFAWILGLFSIAYGVEQKIAAKGHVNCRGVRQPGVFIQLYDEDSIFFWESDDLMGTTNSDAFGTFCIKGKTWEFTQIEPYILIEHNCGYEGTEEKTKYKQYLSPHFITQRNNSYFIEHLGELELLKSDAPIQVYKRRNLVYKHVHRIHQDRINECMPYYATYKDYFEEQVFRKNSTHPYLLQKSDHEFESTTIASVIDHDKTNMKNIEEDILEMEKEELMILKEYHEDEKKFLDELKNNMKSGFHQPTKKNDFSKEEDVGKQPSEGYSDYSEVQEIIQHHIPDAQLLDAVLVNHHELSHKLPTKHADELDEVSSIINGNHYDPCAYRRKRYPHVPIHRNDPCYHHFMKVSNRKF